MKIKTNELNRTALNWAVGMCEGYKPEEFCWADQHFRDEDNVWFSPTDDWAQAGPIIERYEIDLRAVEEGVWEASNIFDDLEFHYFQGPTPLIAAMRCYVASKLGDIVEIPEELS